jgi:hypothetical protein
VIGSGPRIKGVDVGASSRFGRIGIGEAGESAHLTTEDLWNWIPGGIRDGLAAIGGAAETAYDNAITVIGERSRYLLSMADATLDFAIRTSVTLGQYEIERTNFERESTNAFVNAANRNIVQPVKAFANRYAGFQVPRAIDAGAQLMGAASSPLAAIEMARTIVETAQHPEMLTGWRPATYLDVGVGVVTVVTAGRGAIVSRLRVAGAAVESEFVGPLIGKSGFRTSAEFADAVGTRYQGFVDDAYLAGQRLESQGLLGGHPDFRLGNYVDRISQTRLSAYLKSEGISEGPGSLIQLNRYLRDPAGSGLYVRPDVRIPAAGRIYDATVGFKSAGSIQITGFGQYSGGNYITVTRPSPVGGSYSMVP